MGTKKKRDQEVKPAKGGMIARIEETALHLDDLAFFWPHSIAEDLAALGVTVQWNETPEDGGYARHDFHSAQRLLEKVASLSYQLGRNDEQAKATRSYIEELEAKHKGLTNSTKRRARDADRRAQLIISLWAARLEKGDASAKALAAEFGVSQSTVYGHIKKHIQSIRKAASLIRRERPSLMPLGIEKELCERYSANSPGVNRATVRYALKGFKLD